jgi:ABC-type transport system involved in multi-copper enzyme maturation permease subunit
MASITATPPAITPSASGSPLFPNILRSEWTKMVSVRSTWRTLLAAAILMVGLAAILCATYANGSSSAAERATFDPTSFSLVGIQMAQLAFGVLGVLLISSEYATGMIRTTLTAVPQRWLVLAGKATAFTGVTLVIGIGASFISFFTGQAILSGKGLQASISSPGVLRSVVGAGLYLTVFGLMALGLGTVMRHTAGAITTLFGVTLALPGLVALLPASQHEAIAQYLPSNAGAAIYHVHTQAHMLGPWAGLGIFSLYAAVALIAAGVLLTRRDA